MNTCLRLAAFGLMLALATAAPGQTRRALLIGINQYQPPLGAAIPAKGCRGARCNPANLPNLSGPINDVSALRELLARKFDFPAANIVSLTNPALPHSARHFVSLSAGDATHDGLIAAMRKYLVDLPAKGDIVLFYYAGHGSLRLNSQGDKLTVIGPKGNLTHADSTMVVSDAWSGGYDVLDREATHIFNAALDKGVRLTVIFDSCHSGSFARGIQLGPKLQERSVTYDQDDLNRPPEPGPKPAERGALIFSATQQDQSAKETPKTAPEPHGVFTLALLHALEYLPPDAPASTVYEQVRAEMAGSHVDDQEPSLDAGDTRQHQPFFGGKAQISARLRAAAVAADEDGTVTLDAGRLSGIGPGSTFVSLQSARAKMLLEVKALDGMDRSKARIVSPAGTHINEAQIFELDKWIPPPLDPLHVWTWPANLSLGQVTDAKHQIEASGIQVVEDPVTDPWSDLLSWDGTNWVLQHAGAAAAVPLGTSLTAEALRQHLPQDAKLWANIPPPAELVAKFTLHNPTSLVQSVNDVAGADYLLAGSIAAGGPAWTWVHRPEFVNGPHEKRDESVSPGCSATSRYPPRADWIQVAGPDAIVNAADALNSLASRLAKLNGWLHLPSSPDADADYYQLALGADARHLLKDDQVLKPDDHPKMFLGSDHNIIKPRWVYVLDIDCRGKGTLIYPKRNANFENRFPNNALRIPPIELPKAPEIDVAEPYGLDTILLISTTSRLAEPRRLNFEGVSTRQITGGPPPKLSPLEQLLTGTSSGTRGLMPALPTNWSISVTQMPSAPAQP